MKIAYFDIQAGISGDVVLAALISAGLPIALIKETIAKIALKDPWSITTTFGNTGGLPVTMVTINNLSNTAPVGVIPAHATPVTIKQYTYSSLLELVATSSVSAPIKSTCTILLALLATTQAHLPIAAESHRKLTQAQAIETLVHCVGIGVGIEYFKVEAIYISPLPMGHDHPVNEPITSTNLKPLVLSLLKQSQIPLNPTLSKLDLVTPVGAAFLCTADKFNRPMMTLDSTGSGGGQLELGWPNAIHLFVGSIASKLSNNYVLIETNIDDMPANALGFFADKLWSAGAMDVFFTAIQMKKGRPGTKLSIIANETSEQSLANLILNETTTFGVRCVPIHKYEASRTIKTIQTEFGAVRVKIKNNMGKIAGVWPEYDDCAKLAREHNVPFLEVYYLTLLKARTLNLADQLKE